MRKVITVFGGSGFLGRLIARRFAKAGYEVRVAVRRPNQALFVRTYGEVGQVNPIQANVRDEASIRRAIQGADIVVNAVGILYETKFQKFDEIHKKAAGAIARIADEEGVSLLVHISAIGADEEGSSNYARSKAEGENLVQENFPKALIVRPSLIFGGEADFFNRFAKMAQWSPILPLIEGDTKFQPVYADDVAEFVELSLAANMSGIYELGGREILSMREIVSIIPNAIRRKKLLVPMPNILAKIMAWTFSILEILSLRIIKNRILTPDQLKQLSRDNVVTGKDGLKTMKIIAEDFSGHIEPYMQSYRPTGEFEDLVKASL